MVPVTNLEQRQALNEEDAKIQGPLFKFTNINAVDCRRNRSTLLLDNDLQYQTPTK